MIILILFLTLPLISAIIHLGLTHHFEKSCRLTICFMIAFLLLTLYQLTFTAHLAGHITIPLLHLENIKLSILFIADSLTLIMLLLIGLISLMVNLYASRYLYSDLNRSRFMFQLSLVTFSVVFLVMSGNLLTAFIGWQLIGFNLYWLLNHYHYDEQANRAAKKKFVINRVGDMSFLLAIILCLYYYSTTDFHVILNSHPPTLTIFHLSVNALTLILTCVFIAVMTKSAQFPVHIWLPDTMQTPTPVSAIMHAGVINAGGFLLARLSAGLILSPDLLLIVAAVGLITILFGSLFAATQADIKKQLAYSTMSQMGYMVLQCGLGCFAGAIFHLVAHGFFKAWSFLNSGNQLLLIKEKKQLSSSTSTVTIGIILTFGIILSLSLAYHNFLTTFSSYPLLMFFTLITLWQFIINTWRCEAKIIQKLTSSCVMFLLLMLYIKVINLYDLKAGAVFVAPVSNQFNVGLQIIGIIIVGLLLWLYHVSQAKPKIYNRLHYIFFNKLFVEEYYRAWLLNPIRNIGDTLYDLFSKQHFLFVTLCTLIVLSVILASTIAKIMSPYIAVFCCLLLLVFLLSANRARQLKDIVIYLIFSQYALSAIAFQFSNINSEQIAFYQIINTSVVALVMIYCLYKIKNGITHRSLKKNKLPWLSAYFTASLFCLIGLPFTSTFISEIVITKEAISSLPWLVPGLLIAMVLLTISVLHALQDHVFKATAIKKFSIDVSRIEHGFFLLLIGFNIINGIYPSEAMHILYMGANYL